MNRHLVIGCVLGAAAATAIGGMAATGVFPFGEHAEVVAVEPLMKSVSTPREVCGEELVTYRKEAKDKHQITGTIAGAVIGGVLGSKIGGGSGKDIATAGGAVAGGYAGNKIQEKIQDGNTEQRVEQVCQTVYDTREIQQGFEVTYRYEGQEHVVQMDHDPGARIALENGKPRLDS